MWYPRVYVFVPHGIPPICGKVVYRIFFHDAKSSCIVLYGITIYEVSLPPPSSPPVLAYHLSPFFPLGSYH